MKKHHVNWLSRLLSVPATDSDDARRQKLLNILLLGGAVTLLMMFVTTAVADLADLQWKDKEAIEADYSMLAQASVPLILFVINRYRSSWLSSALLLSLMIISIPFNDDLPEVADGRGLLAFAIPIAMASVLLRPWTSFVMAGLSSLVVGGVALSLHWVPNPYSITLFFAIALVSWLSAHTLEQAVREARSEASHTQAILESIADGVIVFDDEGRVTAANPAMLDLVGRPADGVIGRNIKVLLEAGDVDLGAGGAAMHDIISTGQPSRFEWNGRTLSASVSPVRGSWSELAGSVAVLRDVTREVEVERARESLFAVAAHELRTPLHAIINFASMLQVGLLPAGEHQKVAARIVANGERLLMLANNLLERAQIRGGQARLNVERFAPVDLLEQVHEVMETLAKEKGLELSTWVADDVPVFVSADRGRLYQVLTNLVGNAVKFTESGSVHVRLYAPGVGRWVLEVSDTGCGIPPEMRARIFEPFELAEDPVTRQHAGAGLGLYIVKQMVALMGGEVMLESEVGRGSTFTVRLPLDTGD